jgi:delta11-fatty-acid desaturase
MEKVTVENSRGSSKEAKTQAKLSNPQEIEDNRLITLIHNKYYDLTEFNHPGGPVAMALIANRDGTVMFESHHLCSSIDIEKILSKYELLIPPKKEIKPTNIYNWEKTKSSKFTQELKQLAKKEIGTNIKCSWWRVIELILMTLAALSQLIAFKEGHWYSLFTFPLVFWIFSMHFFHDGTHFAISRKWWINRLGGDLGFSLCTPYIWYHQHVIGHHCYPNIPGKDPDLYHAPKIIRHSSDVRHQKPHLYQTATFVISWLLGVPMSLNWNSMKQALNYPSFNRTIPFANTKNLNNKSLVFRFICNFTFNIVMPLAFHGLTVKGIIFAVVPVYLFSLFFMISSQINHLTPHTTEQFDENYFVHQVLTSQDVSTGNYLLYLFTGGLNMQIEHHLFPSMNHCHLRKLVPGVKELCKKHGIRYYESTSLWSALCLHVDHLRKYSVKEQV